MCVCLSRKWKQLFQTMTQIKELATQNATVGKQNKILLESLQAKQKEKPDTDIIESFCLPLKTEQDVQTIEEKLQDKSNYKMLVCTKLVK